MSWNSMARGGRGTRGETGRKYSRALRFDPCRMRTRDRSRFAPMRGPPRNDDPRPTLVNHAAAARFLLCACFLVLLFNGGARFAIGLLLHPMAYDLGWSRSALSFNVTVFMVLSACSLPLVGRLVDRFGPLAVLGGSVIVSALGLAAMSTIGAPWEALIFYGVVFALGSAGTSVTPVGVLLSRWYPNRMGMANSIAISGMGVGQLLVISVLAVQLTVIGWRGSFLALGVATLVCVLPLVFAITKGEPAGAAPALRRGGRGGSGRNARSGTGNPSRSPRFAAPPDPPRHLRDLRVPGLPRRDPHGGLRPRRGRRFPARRQHARVHGTHRTGRRAAGRGS